MKRLKNKKLYFEEDNLNGQGELIYNTLTKSANNIINSVNLEEYDNKFNIFLELKLKMNPSTFNKVLNKSNDLSKSTLKTCIKILKFDKKCIYSDGLLKHLNLDIEEYKKLNSNDLNNKILNYITSKVDEEVEKIKKLENISITELSRYYLGIEPRIYRDSIKNYTNNSSVRLSLFVKMMNFMNEKIKIN